MEPVHVVYLVVLLVSILVICGALFYSAVQKAKKKQALFEDRFSKNYDRYPYRRSKLR